ncbi:MAG: FecR domain-containing protein [Myxococcales bacterium]|nr:FecR domain-containing protein [Myxococcales bacterium]
MSEKYTWDRSGKADDDVQDLEQKLSVLRYDQPFKGQMQSPPRRSRLPLFAAAAAALLLVGGIAGLKLLGSKSPGKEGVAAREPRAGDTVARQVVACSEASSNAAGWMVTTLSGMPSCGERAMEAQAILPVGGLLETDDSSSAEVTVANIGRVVLSPNSRLTLETTGETEHRLQLDRGKLYAKIDAPPRLFLVETPSALAVDLGCEYSLEVQEQGITHLHVTMGYVSLEKDDNEVYVPAGYMSDALPGRGPIAPYADNASPSLREGLLQMVRAPLARQEALSVVLRETSSARDTLTLWHLLSRADDSECEAIVQRLGDIAGAVQEGSCGDTGMREAWREHLESLWNSAGAPTNGPMPSKGGKMKGKKDK